MGDLPSNALFQQEHAHTKTGEELEVLGKTAASKWLEGREKTLNDAVVSTVKHAGLSPEQVKRVCEFANQDAFLREFKKESGVGHKVVDFAGGPADPGAVIQDLNDGGGGSVFDPGTSDYNAPPTEKRASSLREEALLVGMFGSGQETIPFADPMIDVIEVREKLAGAFDHLSSQLSGLETSFGDLSEGLYQQIKQAALNGSSLGEISQVLQVGAPSDEHMKIAFEMLTPRLLQEGVFSSIEQALASMDKTASRSIVNRAHPLVTQMSEFSECLNKLAHTRAARDEINEAQAEITAFIKSAGNGVLIRGAKAVNDAAHKAAPHVGKATGTALKHLIGDNAGQVGSEVAHGAVKHLPKAVAALALLEAGRRVSNHPGAQQLYHAANAHLNPLSTDWDYETYRQQTGGGGFNQGY